MDPVAENVFLVWMRLFMNMSGSVLWLLRADADAEQNLRVEAEKHGIDSTRLIFAGRVNHDEHLARHRLADLFLDTLPYNAHTTACDSVWAGLPFLACLGSTFAGCMAASLLNAMTI